MDWREIRLVKTVALTDAQEIRAAYAAAQTAARDVVYRAGVALRLAADCGKKLCQAANERKGTFDSWLAAEIPEISRPTAWRWRKLAEAPEELWKNAGSLRQAYIDIGILPAPEPADPNTEHERPAGNYLVHLAKAERVLKKHFSEVTKLSSQERSLLKERLEPLVKFYAAL